MRIDRYLASSRVVDLESTTFEGAILELLELCDISKERGLTKKRLHNDLLDREKQMTTYLGNGVCLPHARVKIKRTYTIAVGRCPEGLHYEGQKEYRDIRYVFLLLAAENARSYLYSLASLARVFQDKRQMERLDAAHGLADFRKELREVFGGESGRPRQRHNRFNNLKIISSCPDSVSCSARSSELKYSFGCFSRNWTIDCFVSKIALAAFFPASTPGWW